MTRRSVEQILADRLEISDEGKETLRAAVSLDHDWQYRLSSTDLMIEAVAGLSDADLESARAMAYYLDEALTVVRIRRDMERDRITREAVRPLPEVSR